LKVVLQAIPTYSMSVFLLPATLRKELNGMMQNFWWGNQANMSKIHWMSCENMGFPKNQGDMGFRDLGCFNKALPAKQLWRLLQHPNSLVARIYKAKYYPHHHVMTANTGLIPSFAWRSI
jgi:hypothetical protein